VLYATRDFAWVPAEDAGGVRALANVALAWTRSASTFAKHFLVAAFAEVTSSLAGPKPAPCRVPKAQPAPMTIEDHWARATGVIRAALSSFRSIKAFQASAARQIDAADYALQLLIKDLSAAMPIPADGAALRAVLAAAARRPSAEKKALAA
jgi:hypothetical protein